MSSGEHEPTNKVERKGFLKGTAIGVAVGGLLGAVGGILFAPQSGRETRAQISRLLKNSARDLERRVERVKSRVSDFSDAAGKDLSTLIDRASELKDEILNFSKLTVHQHAEINDDTRKEARRLIDESQKVIADLDRLLAKKMSEVGDVAASTAGEVKGAAKTAGRNVSAEVKKTRRAQGKK